MKITYFRKSKLGKNKVLENLKNFAKENLLDIWGIKEDDNLILIGIYKKDLIENLKRKNPEILSVLPLNVIIIEDEEATKVGLLNPEIFDNISGESISNFFTKMIDAISEAGERKIKKIKIYATTNCPYCKAEKEFLDSKGINYEYNLVDINPLAAQEMIEKTGQYGVPVTEILFDDNEEEYIIGFDKLALEKILSNYKVELDN